MNKKVVIITGASSGIGKATREMLLSNGYIVYNISRKCDVGEFDYSCDVNDFVKIKDIFEAIYQKEKQIDVLINNAGFGIAGAIENTKPENVYNLFNTNLSSVVTLSSLIIPYLKQTKGKIVNIGSVASVIPLPFQACYSAAKAGVLSFSKALAMEVKDFGIKVSCILPGDTKTNFTKARVIDKDEKNLYLDRDEKSIKKMEEDEQKGASPDSVAKVILKVLKKKNPPLKKTVGVSYKLIVFLAKILPDKLLNYIIKKIYG